MGKGTIVTSKAAVIGAIAIRLFCFSVVFTQGNTSNNHPNNPPLVVFRTYWVLLAPLTHWATSHAVHTFPAVLQGPAFPRADGLDGLQDSLRMHSYFVWILALNPRLIPFLVLTTLYH